MKTEAERAEWPPTARGLAALLWAAAGLWALTSCGGSGGVDTGGTGQPVTISSVVVGPITGFGSVVVAGVKFDDSAARIVDDDGAGLASADLQLGMSTTVEAGVITTGTTTTTTTTTSTATAQRIRVSDQLLGPVTAVDTATCSVTVLGQRVAAVAATVVDSSLPATSQPCRLAGLQAGRTDQALRVFGNWDAALQRVVASRVELRAQAAHYVLRGAVDAYDRAERKLTLGGQRISLADLPAAQLPDTLAVGALVRVKLAVAQVNARWPALTLQSGEPTLPMGVDTTIEGRVSQLNGVQQFSVNGVNVDARAAVFTPSGAALVLGAKLEVKGTVTGSTMVARTVAIDTEQNDDEDSIIEIEGRITAVDAAAKTFVLRGTTVSYAANPTWEDSAPGDLVVGRKAAVKGKLSADGRVLVATKIHVEL